MGAISQGRFSVAEGIAGGEPGGGLQMASAPLSAGSSAAYIETADATADGSTPYTITPGDTFNGSISSTGDVDWVAITLSAGSSYSIALSGNGSPSLGNPMLRIYDDNGQLVAQDDDGGSGLNAALSFSPAVTGTYYIEASGVSGSTGRYQASVSAPSAALPTYTLPQIADQLSHGYWQSNGSTWRKFNVAQGGTIDVDISGLTAAGKQLATWALNAWTTMTGINFNTTITGGVSVEMTIDDNASGAYSSSTVSGNTIISSTVNVSTQWLASYGSSLDSYSFQTYLHEIGHALGLGHAGNYNGSATYGVSNHYLNDSWQASVMSYFSQTENSYVYADFAYTVTPMAADILAMQTLYGVPSGLRSGNTTYGENSTAGGIYDVISQLDGAALLASPYTMTIFDQGGTDTLDFRSDTADQRIDLTAGAASDVYGLAGNVVIALNTTIENVQAGSGNDQIFGNSAANQIYGNAGTDLINGNGGNDTLLGGAGADTLNGGAGNDQLFGGSGWDSLDGGENSDVFFVDGGDIVTDSGTVGYDKAQINDAAGVALDLAGWFGVERVNGFTGADRIDASSQTTAILLSGDGGNDTLIGGTGNDTILGGTGNDTLFGGDGNDTMQGGTGNDVFHGGAGNDVIFVGESGDVVADAGSGFDKVVVNNAAGVSLSIGAWLGVERINGYTGNDTIDATGLATGIVMAAGAGNDVLTGGSGNDTFYAGVGDDEMHGGAGADVLIGLNGNDSLDGGAGDDFLKGGLDADTFIFVNGFGQDIVADYLDGTDVLEFRGVAGVSGIGDLVIGQSGANTVITLAGGGGDLITLVNVTATDLDASDFLFT